MCSVESMHYICMGVHNAHEMKDRGKEQDRYYKCPQSNRMLIFVVLIFD